MPERIYVLSCDGHPLMSTTRRRHVKKLLDSGKAKIISHTPFTIQLKHKTEEKCQPLYMGIDPGRSNIGAVVVTENGDAVFSAVCETRNKEIRKLMEKRKQCRRASRRGERKARQRRAKRFGTMLKAGCIMRRLPHYETEILCKAIRNTEARFCNRKRRKNWVTPTVRHLVQTHINLVKMVQKYLPVTDVAFEVNQFAFALLENPHLKGLDFQNGTLKGFDNKEDAVSTQQHDICLMCGKAGIEHYHHLIPRHKGGSDTLDNLAGLCSACHAKIHTDSGEKEKLVKKKQGVMKKYGALSALNQAIPFIAETLAGMFPVGHVHFVTGYETKQYRELLGFPTKAWETNPLHTEDAYCIALVLDGIVPEALPDFQHVYTIRQFRRHNRALIQAQKERIYYYEGKSVAKNRRPRFEQNGDALSDWYEKQVKELGEKEADVMRSRLTVKKSQRSYNNPKRLMPGAIFLYRGERHVMCGQQNNGTRIFGIGMRKSVDIRQCRIIRENAGLVFC